MLTSSPKSSNSLLDSLFNDSRKSAFIRELLTNSGHFLLMVSLSEIALHGWHSYFSQINHYLIAVAIFIQAWYLSKRHANRFLGNLISPCIYTLIDLPIDGISFFQEPIHIVLWIFNFLIAILQGLRFHFDLPGKSLIVILENIVRTLIIVAFYWVLNMNLDQNLFTSAKIIEFYQSPNHKFLMSSLLFLGLLLGLQRLQVLAQQQKLKETALLLHNLANWGLGSHAVTTAVVNPEALTFHRCDRTIVFMDIRNFTSWCEKKSLEDVVATLNDYYHNVELAAAEHQPIRITFTGDEIMAIYPTPQQGVAAAKSMILAAEKAFYSTDIGVGCGVHCGNVIEGLFGGHNVRTYTVIGDVVNTAKRLESATPARNITVSDAIYQALNQTLKVEFCDSILAKGKTEPLKVWRLIYE